MEFLAPTLQLTISSNFQASSGVVEKAWNQESEPETQDTGWVQTDDTEEFNNYTEEY
ncbi:MAG: hypothetical protein PF517_06150 [Salinivirgaceae bacterium]|jgi:hypothetical protein|nr:hypothetical protein [Salinivirgaceae bacterium]